MKVTLTVDVKQLYKQLCPECRKKMLELITVKLEKKALLKILES